MPTQPLEDLTLYFEESGAGRPVLLLHGLGSSGQDWDALARQLASHYRVVVPDLRGHGRSGKPAGAYSVPIFARDLATFCEGLGLTGVHVVGLSMGGMIAFQLALSHPELVRSLVIINSGPDMVPHTLRRRLAFMVRLLLLRLFGPPYLAKLIARRLFPKPAQQALREKTQAAIAANDPDAYRRATQGLIGWTVKQHLSELACPVLVLASDRDYTPMSEKQAYVNLLKNGRLEAITDSGHAAPIDQPDQVLKAIRKFLQEVQSQGRPPDPLV